MEETQIMDMLDTNFKAAIINMFKGLKKTNLKEEKYNVSANRVYQ